MAREAGLPHTMVLGVLVLLLALWPSRRLSGRRLNERVGRETWEQR